MPRFSVEQRNRGIGMLMEGVAVKDVSQAFGCTRLKLMTRYVHNGTVCDRQWPCRPRATTARMGPFYYVDAFCRRRSLSDVMDYLPIWSVPVSGKITIPSVRGALKKARQWRAVIDLPRYNGLDVISSDSVPTGTGVCYDLHSVMLMVELGLITGHTCVMGIAACWKGIDLVASVDDLGW